MDAHTLRTHWPAYIGPAGQTPQVMSGFRRSASAQASAFCCAMRWTWSVMSSGLWLAWLLLVGGCERSVDSLEKLPEGYEATRLAPIYNVDDAGAGDLDGDGMLDLWTTNHSAQQWIALGAADGHFEPGGVKALALHHDARVPGIEASYREPDCPRAGTAIFMERTQLTLRRFAGTAGAFSGRIAMPWPARVTTEDHASWQPAQCEPGVACTRGRFDLSGRGELRIEPLPPPSDGFPISLTLDEGVPLNEAKLGSGCLRPETRRIDFALKDRHGLVLADLAGEDEAAMFVSRGGARGRLQQVHPGALDEFFEWRTNRYEETIATTGIKKSSCPGRQAGAVDIDGDGDLDIYQVCGRSGSANSAAPNRLYIQTARGVFEERAREWGVALPGAGTFAWLPQGLNSEAPDLIWATASEIMLLEYTGQRYIEVDSQPRQGTREDRLLLYRLGDQGRADLALVSPARAPW